MKNNSQHTIATTLDPFKMETAFVALSKRMDLYLIFFCVRLQVYSICLCQCIKHILRLCMFAYKCPICNVNLSLPVLFLPMHQRDNSVFAISLTIIHNSLHNTLRFKLQQRKMIAFTMAELFRDFTYFDDLFSGFVLRKW